LDTGTKQCRKCSEVKSIEEFYVDNKSKDGLKGECKECVKLYKRTHKKERQELNNRYKRTAKCKFSRLRQLAKKRDVEFYLDLESFSVWYENIPNICHYCGCEIVTSNDKSFSNSLSIDRLNSTGAYILSNIVKSCHGCNCGKGNSKYTEFLEKVLDRKFIPEGMKCCSKCKEVKSLQDFYKDRTARDGYHNVCKTCSQTYYKKYWAEHRSDINMKKRGC